MTNVMVEGQAYQPNVRVERFPGRVARTLENSAYGKIVQAPCPYPSGRVWDPYEVLAPIGAGGMGEVYRARDTKLYREVAIKVLPAALAQYPESPQPVAAWPLIIPFPVCRAV